MKRLSDDEWVARARSRFATKGTWDTEPWNVADAKPDPPKSTGPTCPYCTKRPRLEEFRRYQSATSRPLLVCEACYGFWAVDNSLSVGFADLGDVPQGVFSHVAMRRCRACGGHLKPDGRCVKCGQSLPKLNCPVCGSEMNRYTQGSVTLDACSACKGTWFDTGELAAVFGLAPTQGLASRTVSDTGPTEGSLIFEAATILARAFLPLP